MKKSGKFYKAVLHTLQGDHNSKSKKRNIICKMRNCLFYGILIESGQLDNNTITGKEQCI